MKDDYQTDEQYVLPEWAIQDAERRLNEFLADPSIAISEEEMWRRVDAGREQPRNEPPGASPWSCEIDFDRRELGEC
jgi:hypothetical protein